VEALAEEDNDYDSDPDCHDTLADWGEGTDNTGAPIMDDSAFLNQFIMPLSACPIARRIVEPHCKTAIGIVHVLFEDPRGHYGSSMKPCQVNDNAGIYVILDEHGRIIKVGYSKHLKQRRQYYVAKGISACRFRVILDLDNMIINPDDTEDTTDKDDEDATDDDTANAVSTANNALEELYKTVKQELLASDELHPFQKYFFRSLFLRQGEGLGAKVTFMLQMLESGYQMLWKLPRLMEFLMFDKTVCDLWYQDTADWSRKLLALLPLALRKAAQQGPLKLLIISSWAVGGKRRCGKPRLSCKLLTNEAIGGNQGRDTLPVPVFPDAETTAEIFSTNFHSDERETGRNARLYIWLREMLTSDEPCLILLDSNDLLFGGDSRCQYSSIYEMLASKFGMIEIQHGYGNEVVIYVDLQYLHVVAVNRPFSVGGDSRLFISLLKQVRRARSATVLLNLVRLLKGQEPLNAYCPTDEFQNPIHGILSSMTIQKGSHMRGVIPSAHYREGISAKETYALVENDIPKLDSSGAAFSTLVRRRQRKRLFLSHSDSNPRPRRVDDTRLYLEFRATISQAEEGAVEGLFDTLYGRSQRGTNSVGTAWNCMKITLLQGVLETASPLCATLTELWNNQKGGSGNPNAWGRQKTTVCATNVTLPVFVAENAESPTQAATPFWIRLREDVPQLDSLDRQYQVLNSLALFGLHERTTSRNRNGLTNAITAEKFPHLGIHRVVPSNEKNGYVLVKLLPCKSRTRTQTERDQEYNEFVPRHLHKRFWVRSPAEGVDELYTDEFDLSDTAHFPYGHEIFNAQTWEGLTKKFSRSKRYGMTRIKGPTGGFVLEHGYYCVVLGLRKTRPRKTR
jgi:hypothetical protein